MHFGGITIRFLYGGRGGKGEGAAAAGGGTSVALLEKDQKNNCT